MVDRMKVEGGKVTVEGGAVTSVDFVGSDVILELGVTLRNCTFDVDTVLSTVGAPTVVDEQVEVASDVTPGLPPVPPMPVLSDVEL